MSKLKMHSPNIVDNNIEKVGKLFPNCITERKNDKGEIEMGIDFDMLRQELSNELIEGNEERYQFTWPDKRQSILLANAPIAKTLRPCREESVNFDTTENLYIEGDNLDVLKLLQETYLGKVKMIYIDPPYNAGSDFVYEDDFSQSTDEYLANSGQYDEEGNRLVKNLDSNGRFHTDWLNMMYPRLKLAKDLLTEDGVIFISIDDNEVENMKKICNEVFGEKNYMECITWNKRIPKNDKGIGSIHEYILLYVKNIRLGHEFLMRKDGLDDIYQLTEKLKRSKASLYDAEKEVRALYKKNGYDRGITLYNSLNKEYKLWGKINMSWPNANTFGPRYEVLHPKTNRPVKIPDRGWRWKRETFDEAAGIIDGRFTSIEELYDGTFICGKVWFDKNENTQPSSVTLLDDVNHFLLRSVLSMKSDGGIELEKLFDGKSYFSYPKPTALLKVLLSSIMGSDEIILDFFSGSASTADAIMKLNAEDNGRRKFIMVQIPEETEEKSEAYKAGYPTICEIGKERIRRAAKRIIEEQKEKETDLFSDEVKSIDYGFRVLKLDSTNMKDVYYNPIQYTAELFSTLADNIKDDRTAEDLLFQVMLDLGVLLSSKIEESIIDGKKVFNVEDNYLIACFDDNVTDETITAIAKQKPYYFVMRDSSMASDAVASNFEQIFETYSKETVRRVL